MLHPFSFFPSSHVCNHSFILFHLDRRRKRRGKEQRMYNFRLFLRSRSLSLSLSFLFLSSSFAFLSSDVWQPEGRTGGQTVLSSEAVSQSRLLMMQNEREKNAKFEMTDIQHTGKKEGRQRAGRQAGRQAEG
jgi:hypothetical protein